MRRRRGRRRRVGRGRRSECDSGVERRAVAGWLTWGGGTPSGSMCRNVCRVSGLRLASGVGWRVGPGRAAAVPAECDASTVDDSRNERAPCFRERDQILTFDKTVRADLYVVGRLRDVRSRTFSNTTLLGNARSSLWSLRTLHVPRSAEGKRNSPRTGYCPLGRRC